MRPSPRQAGALFIAFFVCTIAYRVQGETHGPSPSHGGGISDVRLWFNTEAESRYVFRRIRENVEISAPTIGIQKLPHHLRLKYQNVGDAGRLRKIRSCSFLFGS